MAKKKNLKSKPLSGEQKIESLAKLGKAPKDTVITIPDEAIINVPISGSFRKAIEDVLFYIMGPMTAEEIMETMGKIKIHFKDIPAGKITQRDKAVWTIMSLQSEINFQAADQKKTVVGNDPVKEKLSTLLYDMDPEGFIKENNERKSNVD